MITITGVETATRAIGEASKEAAPASGSATNLNNATHVRVYNYHESTPYLVTITNKDEDTILESFTLNASEVAYVDKEATDEIFAADTSIKLTSC
jgi:hypothetical protein